MHKELESYEKYERKHNLVTGEDYQAIRKLIIEELISKSDSNLSDDIPVMLRLIKMIDNWESEYNSFVAKRQKEKE